MIFYILISVAATLVFAALVSHLLIKYDINLGLMSPPNKDVLTHIDYIPLIGGIAIFSSVVICGLYFFINLEVPVKSYLLGLIPVALLGLYKDRFQEPLSPVIQICFQLLSSIQLYQRWININHYDFQWHSALIFVLLCCIIINSFNFIDVMDGLAGGYILTVFMLIGLISIYKSNLEAAILSFSFCGALLGFLKYNWHPAKLFMGDFGSFGLIYSALFLLITSCPVRNSYTYLSFFLVFSVILFEFSFTFLRRIILKQSPLVGDHNHISLILLNKGNKSNTIVAYTILITAFTNLVAFYFYLFCF